MSLRVFIGYDPRQPIAPQVLSNSIWKRASGPVSITRLQLNQLPLKRVGLTEFTYSRYLVPFLCGYEGRAIFMDADMLCLGDVYELDRICASQDAGVCVVKNPRLRFEWPSMMHFNNNKCIELTPDIIETGNPQSLDWSARIGEAPSEWNHLVGYDPPRADAKLVHFTQGIPCFKETTGCEYEAEWVEEMKAGNATVSWQEIMGNSVHAKPVMERLMRRAAA